MELEIVQCCFKVIIKNEHKPWVNQAEEFKADI